MNITSGKGHAELLEYEDWQDNDFYIEFGDDIAKNLNCDVEDITFLEDLANGGEKGAGLKVLQKALRYTQQQRNVLVLFVFSASGQDKLRDWYLKTGLLVQIPTKHNTTMANWLIDKSYLSA